MGRRPTNPWQGKQKKNEEFFERKRQAVLRTAVRAFVEKGFDRTSLDEIAETLNVTKPTLYYYIKNKNDILVQCNQIAQAKIDQSLADARASGGTGLEILLQFFREYGQVMADDFIKCTVLNRTQLRAVKPAEELRQNRVRVNEQVIEIIKQGIADGSIEIDNPKLASYFVFGAFNATREWYSIKGNLSPEEVAGKYTAYLEKLLRPSVKKAARANKAAKKKKTK